ncbi:hypothetical protein AB0A76_32775 [Streptomyces exfoliatus]|uniref:Uncharacterized protein n=1 Tax=Streptomyces exfoliatus TaxID=1905 RepID=A0ABV3D697_STREX
MRKNLVMGVRCRFACWPVWSDGAIFCATYGLLRAGDLAASEAAQRAAFEDIRMEPSSRLLDHVGSILEGNSAFALVGDQQDAFLQIRATAALHLPGRGGCTAPGDGTGAVITVRGGPSVGRSAPGSCVRAKAGKTR